GPVVVIGDAAQKFEALPGRPDAGSHRFIQCCPEAASMLVPAMRKLQKKEFEDLAYFEPFYLKQFIATVPKKLF
nr:tRNA (adenosine(37)-N6)-threonylcarbamoyltransferase complex dimerization subunit type 1 TsaB [Bacteroidales bacterium]